MATKDARRKDAPAIGRRSSTDHVEAEWQFEAEDLAAAEEWLKRCPAGPELFVEPAGVRDVRDTYFDTDDWRVYRAGYALRVRESDGAFEATMKSLSRRRDQDGARRRREISAPLKDVAALHKKTSGPVGERLRVLTGGPSRPDHAPHALFEVRTRRTVFELRLAAQGDGAAVADSSGSTPAESAVHVGEVVLDATEIEPGGEGVPLLLRRVEVETQEYLSPLIKRFAAKMRDELDLHPVLESKYEAGIAHVGLTPAAAPDFGPTSIKRSMTAGDLAFAVLREQLAAMQYYEPGTRLGENPEELHDMRVATRRMRAAMKLFEDALPERCQWFREELKFFASVLGRVRDLDVLIQDQRTRATETEAGKERREPLEKIAQALEKERDEARKALLETLDSERYERFHAYFATTLREGPDGAKSATVPAAVLGRTVISTARDKCLKAAKRLKKNSPPEAYHDLRKKGKRLRYVLEFLSGVYGKKTTTKLVKALKETQDTLGAQQDAIVAMELLRSLAVSSRRLSRATVFEIGASAERHTREAEAARSGFAKSGAFETFLKGKAWKDFDRDMRSTIKKVQR